MRRLSSLSISSRLVALVVITAVGLAGAAAVAAFQDASRIMTERKASVSSVVETALGVVRYYGAERRPGG